MSGSDGGVPGRAAPDQLIREPLARQENQEK